MSSVTAASSTGAATASGAVPSITAPGTSALGIIPPAEYVVKRRMAPVPFTLLSRVSKKRVSKRKPLGTRPSVSKAEAQLFENLECSAWLHWRPRATLVEPYEEEEEEEEDEIVTPSQPQPPAPKTAKVETRNQYGASAAAKPPTVSAPQTRTAAASGAKPAAAPVSSSVKVPSQPTTVNGRLVPPSGYKFATRSSANRSANVSGMKRSRSDDFDS